MKQIRFGPWLIVVLFFVNPSISLAANIEGIVLPKHSFINSNLLKSPNRIDTLFLYAKKTVEQPVMMDKTLFNGAVKLLSSTFEKNVDLNFSKFMQPVQMNEVRFKAPFNASWVEFKKTIDVYHSLFDQEATFFNCLFFDVVKFFRVEFKSSVVFHGSHFLKNTSFLNAIFANKVSFSDAKFHRVVLFDDSDFEKGVNFSHAHFYKQVSFESTVFHGASNFSYAKFDEGAAFPRAFFSGTADFSYVSPGGDGIDLTRIRDRHGRQKTRLNLVGADIGQFKLFYHDFELFFPLNVTMNQKNRVYKLLLKNFKQNGDDESYNALYPEYRHFLYDKESKWLVNYIQKTWWNYGLNTEWVFMWVGWIILLYTFINALFFNSIVTKYYNIPFLEKKIYDFSIKANVVIKYIYYLPWSFALTLILFFGGTLRLGLNTQQFKSTNLLVNLYFLFIMCSGFVCIFFMLKYLVGNSL